MVLVICWSLSTEGRGSLLPFMSFSMLNKIKYTLLVGRNLITLWILKSCQKVLSLKSAYADHQTADRWHQSATTMHDATLKLIWIENGRNIARNNCLQVSKWQLEFRKYIKLKEKERHLLDSYLKTSLEQTDHNESR